VNRGEHEDVVEIRTMGDHMAAQHPRSCRRGRWQIRDLGALDELQGGRARADAGSIVLRFELPWRRGQIGVTDSASWVMPPALLDAAEKTQP
jgi:hypothetical protein